MSHLFRDARSAVQSLLASPAHTALVVVTLALTDGRMIVRACSGK